MKARRKSLCIVCSCSIHPGTEIEREDGIGWIHATCRQRLDCPIDGRERASMSSLYGPRIRTYRQLAEANIRLDSIEDDEPYPIDHEDMGSLWF